MCREVIYIIIGMEIICSIIIKVLIQRHIAIHINICKVWNRGNRRSYI